MVDIKYFRDLALSYADTDEKPHHSIPSFRYKGKIFATYWPKENWAMLKLSLVDQSIFCAFDSTVFFPVQGAWGKQGATLVALKKVRIDMFKDALEQAYLEVTRKTDKK